MKPQLFALAVTASILVACGGTPAASTLPTTGRTGPAVSTTAPTVASPANVAPPSVPTLQTVPYTDLVQLFDYDQHKPVDVQEQGVFATDKNIHNISYDSPKGGRVLAFLVVPPGTGPFAGIVFLHAGGFGREEFLDEAKTLARRGAVGLLIEGPFEPEGNDHDRDQLIQIVLNLRRGVDLLLARRDVDPQRIGFVGHSDGANIGGVLAGVEKRIKAYVLMSGSAETSKDLAHRVVIKDAAQKERYFALMAQLDPIHFIGHAAPVALFFQNARHDELVPEQDAKDFQQAGSEPKLVKWYEGGHMLDLDAQRDRAEWLRVQLNLTSVP